MTSSNAILTVTNIPPVITLQPTNQTVVVGSTVTNIALGTGVAPFSFQWLKDGVNLTNGTTISGSIISGATNFTLIISNAQTSDSGNYWLYITTAGGSINSSIAVLTVIVPSPSFGKIVAAGEGGFILSGNGGDSNGTYYVLTSSNLLVPLATGRPLRPINLTATAISSSPTPRKPTRRKTSIFCKCRDSAGPGFIPAVFSWRFSRHFAFLSP